MPLKIYNLDPTSKEREELSEFLGDETRWNYLTWEDIDVPKNPSVMIKCNQVGMNCEGEFNDHYVMTLIKKLGKIIWDDNRDNIIKYNEEREGTDFKEKTVPEEFQCPNCFHFRIQWGKFGRMSSTKVEVGPLHIHNRYLIHLGSPDSYILSKNNRKVIVDMNDGDFISLPSGVAKDHTISTEKGKFRTNKEGKRLLKRPDHIRRTIILDIDLPLSNNSNDTSNDSSFGMQSLNDSGSSESDSDDQTMTREETEKFKMEEFIEESIEKFSRETKFTKEELREILKQAQE